MREAIKPIFASMGTIALNLSNLPEKLSQYSLWLKLLGEAFTVLISVATFFYILAKIYNVHLSNKEKRKNGSSG